MFRLLIVDDEDLVRRGLSALIQREAPEITIVGTAADGVEALTLAENTRPDIICTDIRMPGLSGLDLIERLKAVQPGVHTIILSGYDDFSYARRAIGLGVSEYLLKPVDVDGLLAILTRLRARITEERREDQLRRDAAFFAAGQVVRRLFEGGKVDSAALAAALPAAPAWGLALVYPFAEDGELPPSPEDAIEGAAEAWTSLVACCTAHAPGSIVVLDAYGYYCVIFPLDDAQDTTGAAQAAAALFKGLGQAGWTAAVTAARPVAFAANLKEAHDDAVARADYMMAGPGEGPLLCWELSPEVERWPVLPRGRRDALLDAVTRGDEEDAARTASGFLSHLHEQRLAPSALHALWVEMAVLVIDHVQGRGVRVDALFDHWDNPHAFLLDRADAAVLDARFLELARRAAHAMHAMSGRQAVRGTIAEVQAYVEDHIGDDLTINTLARHVHLNATYLGALFKSVTGDPLGEYIIQARMRHACALLTDSALKVYEVAERVGYGGPRHFATMFRTTIGVTPAEYRERRRNGFHLASPERRDGAS